MSGQAVIIGAGPAGLTAAVELCRAGLPVQVFERDGIAGGIARTEQYKGYYFDIGGHRFFTKIDAVRKLWHELLKEDFLLRPRALRIYYQGKSYHYPLQVINALSNLGLRTSAARISSPPCRFPSSSKNSIRRHPRRRSQRLEG